MKKKANMAQVTEQRQLVWHQLKSSRAEGRAFKLGWDAMAPDTSSKVRYLPSATLLDSIAPARMLLN